MTSHGWRHNNMPFDCQGSAVKSTLAQRLRCSMRDPGNIKLALVQRLVFNEHNSRAVKPIISDQLCILWIKHEIWHDISLNPGGHNQVRNHLGSDLWWPWVTFKVKVIVLMSENMIFSKNRGRKKCDTSFWCDFYSRIHSRLFFLIIFNNSRSPARSKGQFKGQKCQNLTFNENNYR